jgi:hypothetical protein
VIAARGLVPAEQVQNFGARLLVVFEQADQMDATIPRCEAVTVELGSRHLTGLRGPGTAATRFTVGMLGPEPLSREARAAIDRILGKT